LTSLNKQGRFIKKKGVVLGSLFLCPQVDDYTKLSTPGGDIQKFFRNGGKIFELDTAPGIQKYYRMYVGHNDFFIIFVI
jgi:hypothetical protein